ncbi:MAG: response regulator [Acidobacteria bacterium]|nr:response regulator [Acidobacteriota bacterium]
MPDKKTVLIIDDEPDTRTYFSNLLEDEGFETMVAENGDEALKKVSAKKPDLITLDITMPETSGVRCYRELRENEAYRDIPVIMVTGISEKFQDFISSRRQVPPPDGYLPKPVDEKELVDLAHRLTA